MIKYYQVAQVFLVICVYAWPKSFIHLCTQYSSWPALCTSSRTITLTCVLLAPSTVSLAASHLHFLLHLLWLDAG